MQKLILAAIGLTIAGGGSAFAQEDTTLQPSSEAQANPVNHVVCRRAAAPTGSRIGARNICRTQHEWDVINREARNSIEEAQNRSKQSFSSQ
ncbi:MAG: hypothetical protein ABR601_04180 [Parasphingopyxis sp.]|nr:hypothetical protein [Sphingomonadales bacterium]